jgi:hypothetical protein
LEHPENPSRQGRSREPHLDFKSNIKGEKKIRRQIQSQHSRSEREIDGLSVYLFSLSLFLVLLFCHEILLLLFYHVWLNVYFRGDDL